MSDAGLPAPAAPAVLPAPQTPSPQQPVQPPAPPSQPIHAQPNTIYATIKLVTF